MPVRRSHWNYRVIRDGKLLGLHEIYYNGDGTLRYWTASPVAIQSETRRGILWVIARMAEGVKKPVLVRRGNVLVEELRRRGKRMRRESLAKAGD